MNIAFLYFCVIIIFFPVDFNRLANITKFKLWVHVLNFRYTHDSRVADASIVTILKGARQ